MLKIKVNFPAEGNPTVAGDQEAAIAGSPLVWDVTSFNKKVDKCRVQFDNGKLNYFGQRRKRLDKKIKYGPDGMGSVQIEATAPAIRSKKKHLRHDKYTVFGLDAKGKVLCENDPEIIVIRPGG